MQTLVCCRYKREKKMDEVTHTILPNTAGGGWGGTALGASKGIRFYQQPIESEYH